MKMDVDRRNHVAPMECEVELVSLGVGRTVCPECGDDQARYRSYFPPELDIPECVDFKGTGYVYVDM
jgi:hypothetical protein